LESVSTKPTYATYPLARTHRQEMRDSLCKSLLTREPSSLHSAREHVQKCKARYLATLENTETKTLQRASMFLTLEG
jgi:hypothetical protein